MTPSCHCRILTLQTEDQSKFSAKIKKEKKRKENKTKQKILKKKKTAAKEIDMASSFSTKPNKKDQNTHVNEKRNRIYTNNIDRRERERGGGQGHREREQERA